MQYISSILTLLFFLGGLTSIFWGIYIIRLDLKSNINRLFLLICVALGIWSFGFGMANLSIQLEKSLFWRRFASIGMISLFSFILHFLLLLTDKRKNRKDRKIFLLYIPAIILMFVFTFYPNLARRQYDLVDLGYGLTNIAENSIWNFLYYIYYSLYMSYGLILVWNWKRRLDIGIKKKQAKFIIISILLSLVFASFTDIISEIFSSNPIPQIAPLWILLPVWAMYYSVRYYDLINYEESHREEIIITEKEKTKIFKNIAKGFIFSGVLSFIIEYGISITNFKGNFRVGYLEGVIFIMIGFSLYFIQNIKEKSLKEFLNISILVGSIPLVILKFIDYAATTVWAYPIIIVIASLVLSNKKLLVLSGIASIITQILIWVINPNQIVTIDQNDYMFRIIILLTAIISGYYINKIYIAKMEENEFRIKFQELNAKMSSEILKINKENKDEKIDKLLSEMGLFFKSDRTYLFLIDHDNDTMTYSYEWCNKDVKPELGTIENIPISKFPWLMKTLQEEKVISIEDTRNMKEGAKEEQNEFMRRNIKSLITVPVEGADRIKGFLGIDSVNSYREWPKKDISLLNVLSNLLSDAFIKLESEKEIEYLAYYDGLTNLPNRYLFKEKVRKNIKKYKKENANMNINIIFIDLDNFKSVNDTIGHDGGDYLLKQVAENLKEKIEETDMVARFGGDEFMIMLDNKESKGQVYKIAEDIMDIFLKPFKIYGQEFFITVSAGISKFPEDGEEAEILIKNADTAMYEAKSKGKNQYVFCTTDLKDEVEKNMTILNDLHYALERQEFEVYYQPQIDLGTNEIVGLEALLRWNHPKLGMIPPNKFIPIAEKNGIMNSIGNWVLIQACFQNKKWQDMGLGYLRMAVNLSGSQFINAKISDQVSKVLEETGLNPKYLELEITENIAIKETEFVVKALEELKKIGVSIAIDDFGTEYSSLSRLRVLPIDRIKIDMEFIHGIENNDKDKAITTVIISLAKNLGLEVLAEGVETGPQLDFLNEKMCNNVQGHYYYKAMPAEEMEKVLKDI